MSMTFESFMMMQESKEVKTSDIKKLFEPFFKGIDAADCSICLSQVYYVKNTEEMFFSPRHFSRNRFPVFFFPPDILKKKDYFIVDFWIKMGPDKGYINLKHGFHIDLKALEVELKKISGNQAIPDGHKIAEIIESEYKNMNHLLADINGVGNDYPKIAKLVYNCLMVRIY